MPYHKGVWRPNRRGPISYGSTVVINDLGERGTVEGTAAGPTICVRINGSIRIVKKNDIVDVSPPWETHD